MFFFSLSLQLEELEEDLSHGSHTKSTQVLRSLPTPMLSDVQAIFDETKMRSESLAQLVFQRVRPPFCTAAPLRHLHHSLLQTAEVDTNIQAIGQSRNGLRISREALERDVQVMK